MINGSSGYGQSGTCGLGDGTIARDPSGPWLCAACAGLTGRI